jgi:hypothetical protein
VVTIGRVSKHNARRHAVCDRVLDLADRNMLLGLEGDLLGDACFFALLRVVRPTLGQIEAVRDGKTRGLVCHGEGDGNLAILLFSEHPTPLLGDVDGVPPLLRVARVIDDPCPIRVEVLDARQRLVSCRCQQDTVAPRRRRDQMVHRLMSRPNLVNPDDLKGLQDNLLRQESLKTLLTHLLQKREQMMRLLERENQILR